MDKLIRLVKEEAASHVLQRFLVDFDEHTRMRRAGIEHGSEWIRAYPEKFVNAIELAARLAEIQAK